MKYITAKDHGEVWPVSRWKSEGSWGIPQLWTPEWLCHRSAQSCNSPQMWAAWYPWLGWRPWCCPDCRQSCNAPGLGCPVPIAPHVEAGLRGMRPGLILCCSVLLRKSAALWWSVEVQEEESSCNRVYKSLPLERNRWTVFEGICSIFMKRCDRCEITHFMRFSFY